MSAVTMVVRTSGSRTKREIMHEIRNKARGHRQRVADRTAYKAFHKASVFFPPGQRGPRMAVSCDMRASVLKAALIPQSPHAAVSIPTDDSGHLPS